MTTTLTSKGQIVIPKNIRSILDLHPGVKLTVEIKNGSLFLHPVDTSNQLKAIHKKVKQHLLSNKISPVSNQDIQKSRSQIWTQH